MTVRGLLPSASEEGQQLQTHAWPVEVGVALESHLALTELRGTTSADPADLLCVTKRNK